MGSNLDIGHSICIQRAFLSSIEIREQIYLYFFSNVQCQGLTPKKKGSEFG
jgi:hypothetical protein